MYKIGVDAMGGDHAPAEIVKAAHMAVEKYPDIEVVLYGRTADIKKHLPSDHKRISIVHCEEVIDMDVSDPAHAVRRQKDASLVVASKAVKNKEIDALVSAGATGAIIAAGTLLVKRLKSADRPALAPILPTVKKGRGTILCDAGATSEAKASYIYQNAKLADVYAREVLGITKPTIGLLNIGTEDSKGGELQQEAFALLKADTQLNFIGNVEAKSMISGEVDIIAADGYSGNVALKAVEGTAKDLLGLIKSEIMSTTKGKLGGLLLKDTFGRIKDTVNPKTVGGAILLGINAPVIKSSGSSDAETFMYAIEHGKKAVEMDVVSKIDHALTATKSKTSGE